jgi:hypothetical protein
MSHDQSPLDSFIDHVMRGQLLPAVAAMGPTDSSARADWACNELIWPTLEVLQDLAAAGQVPRATYNRAIKVLSAATDCALRIASPTAPCGRSAMVLTVPGEREEFGAAIFARIAEAHGWTIHFAGAGVTHEEIMFALGRLTPEVVIIHGGLIHSAAAVGTLVEQLQRVGVWPITQTAACGRAVEHMRGSFSHAQPDLLGRTPIELLELMQLCPEFRTHARAGAATATHAAPLAMLHPPELEIFPEAIRRRLAGRFGPGESN